MVGTMSFLYQWNTFVEELIQKEDPKNNGWKNYNATKDQTKQFH
jgi:hypothetical protein